MKRLIALLFTVYCSVSAFTCLADEGMWLLQLLKQQHAIDMMKQQGLLLEAEDLYNPDGPSLMNAVGIFGGGCTGEIISPEGLILTNHHCGYGALQRHSSVEHDYLTTGFWSMSREEELPTPGLSFTFVESITDVTDVVEEKIKSGEVDEVRAMGRPFLAKLGEELMAASEYNGKKGYRPQVLPFYAGNKYYYIVYKSYSDVRMVAAPPSSIGKFGGETDNWMWPRHTGDFSMFRIYATADGEPADYSPENVPLQTPTYLTISIKGLDEGDYAMVMGFPGSTQRYLTQSEVKQRMTARNQAMIDMRTVRLEILRQYMESSDAIRIQYASKFAGSSNYWKNSIGMNQAIIDNNVLGTKAEIEKAFSEWAKGKEEYEGVVEKIDAVIEAATPYMRQLMYTTEALRSAIELSTPVEAMDKLKQALEEGNEADKEAAIEQLRKAYERVHNKDYDQNVDRAVAKAMLPALAEALSRDELPSFYTVIYDEYEGDFNAYVDDMYDTSIFANESNFEAFVANPTVKAIDRDLSLAYSRSRDEAMRSVMMAYNAANEGLDLLHKAYIRGLNEMNAPTPAYPDANFTIRLTYGNVKSYQPRDAIRYNYYTTTEGVLEKEDPSNSEFVVPAKLKELIQNKDYGRYAMANGDMPVCFLTTNDITGGNSGSPVLDAEGRLIGCAFDGNWESLSGDINFDNDLQRCIALDIRYMLFVLDKFGGCQRLIDEMTIVE